jgi:hypothetical protein
MPTGLAACCSTPNPTSAAKCCPRLQVQADVYEKIDKELLGYVEDVLLNRRADATERMLEYAATLDPKSKPTAVRKLNAEPEVKITPRANPLPPGVDPLAPDANLPPVPTYKAWVDPIKKSAAFDELEALMKERIIFIDGAMGTQIQKYKLQEDDFRGERWVWEPGCLCMHWAGPWLCLAMLVVFAKAVPRHFCVLPAWPVARNVP